MTGYYVMASEDGFSCQLIYVVCLWWCNILKLSMAVEDSMGTC